MGMYTVRWVEFGVGKEALAKTKKVQRKSVGFRSTALQIWRFREAGLAGGLKKSGS